ncbi:MAG TPA: SDR family oxidoreductase [Chitinophagaceae bacterium]|nr:SDR family oxidoreductase [Chitinophagaceae bacterium]
MINDKREARREVAQKTIVITGASSGAGRAIALELAKNGAKLVLTARREEALKKLAEECQVLGASVLIHICDVTDAASVKAVADLAKQWGGTLDVWVNNAGVLAAGSFEETPIEVHQKVINTNLIGYINGAHAALFHFKEQGFGTLINNISVGAWFPTPYASAYTASKFGLNGFFQSLKGELQHFPHIHVCDLFPAFIDTPGIQHAANYTGHVLRPAPPVYDPQKVARAVTRMILHPKPSDPVMVMSSFLKIAHTLFPTLSRRITAGVIESYLKAADTIPHTSGNILETVEYGTSVHGGWILPATEKKKAITKSILAASFLLGFVLLGRRL